MKKLRIFGLLSSIRSIELKRFQKYIRSDSLYTSRDYEPLTNHLLKYYPDFTDKELTLESMYNSLYPGKKYNQRVIISRLSELNKITENFLLSRRLENKQFTRSMLLAEELMERKEFDTFELVINKLLKDKRNRKSISEQHLYELDQLLMIKGNSYMMREEYNDSPMFLRDHIEIFITYFLSRLFSMYGFVKNLEEFQQPGNSLEYLEEYMQKIDLENITKIVSNSKHSVYLDIIFNVHKLNMTKNDDELYYNCKDKFYRYIDYFDTSAKFIIFNFFYTYCIYQVNVKKNNFINEMYELLKNVIKHRSYSMNPKDYMPSMLFRETVITGIKLKDHSGVNNFIKNYSDQLAPEYKDTMLNFSLGKLKLAEKKYAEALKAYKKCAKNILIITIDVNMDMLICYYELGLNEDIRESLQKNFALLRSPVIIPDIHRGLYEKFIEVFNQLYNLKINPDKTKLSALLNEVEKLERLNYRKWIINKLEDKS